MQNFLLHSGSRLKFKVFLFKKSCSYYIVGCSRWCKDL